MKTAMAALGAMAFGALMQMSAQAQIGASFGVGSTSFSSGGVSGFMGPTSAASCTNFGINYGGFGTGLGIGGGYFPGQLTCNSGFLPFVRPCLPTTSIVYATGFPIVPTYVNNTAGLETISSLQNQNNDLRRQVDQLQAQNDQLRKLPPPVQVKAPLRKPSDAAAKLAERQRIERAKQASLSGGRLFAKGNYRRSAERFREAAELAGNDPSPHFLQAQSLFAAKEYQAAAEAIKAGLDISPDWLELDFDVRSLYQDPNDLVPQLAHLAKSVKAAPLDRNALFVLGYELFVSGERDKARTILEQAVRLEPDDRHLKPFFDYYDRQADLASRADTDGRRGGGGRTIPAPSSIIQTPAANEAKPVAPGPKDRAPRPEY